MVPTGSDLYNFYNSGHILGRSFEVRLWQIEYFASYKASERAEYLSAKVRAGGIIQ